MTVVEFTPRVRYDRHCSGWRPVELTRIVDAIGPEVASRNVAGWDVDTTEEGDPQFYVLTGPPENDCVLCISRIGTTYVLEDGQGRILCERDDLKLVTEAAKKHLRRGRFGLVPRVLAVWIALRTSVEEKIDGLLVESEELLVHIAPQIAAII